ncbi:ATP-dependent nuclease [Leptospira barantonii]|uniref:AAA+ ATPase domain-containing protein n=1 Tax=Leptospira barantonii TaxID=2023184 RepID=A0ABX4NKN7_9LEPT|nr:AAA family ATPase [Leptospira barantonii]PJZ57232.1 hypothetical protein CH367_10895 [Leptospira barantonii]
MANAQNISKAIKDIDDVFLNPPARNGLYGNILKSVSIENVRGIKEKIEFNWPVSVIAGINGSGKTTFLQMCSTAYVKEQGGRHFKVGDWIRGALKGETSAIDLPAKVGFTFWDDTIGFDVPYSPSRTRWEYPKKASILRNVYFIGISNFAPRIEKKDRVNIFKSQIEIRNTKSVDSKITASISQILEIPYTKSELLTVGIKKGEWSDTFPKLERNGISYTEPHMGAGEQKIVRLIEFLESLPKKSLILLEEPELTLHPDAQKGLGWYLMTLSKRNGHQIIIATHSQDIFDTLPPQARKLIIRDKIGHVSVLYNIPEFYAARELSKSVKTNKDIIFVEDTKAKALLSEIFQRYNRSLFENTTIIPVGNTDDVKKMVTLFYSEGQRVIGIRDADIGESPDESLFSLPGQSCIEKELLDEANIIAAEQFLNGITTAFKKCSALVSQQQLSATDKSKKIFNMIFPELSITEAKFMDRIILCWIETHKDEIKNFVQKIANKLNYTIAQSNSE